MSNLRSYPRPNVAVDVAVLTAVVPDQRVAGTGHLAVLTLSRAAPPTGPVLPGRFLREGETVRACVQTTISEKGGITVEDAEPRLLRVFDAPDRDPRAWTITLAHALALPAARLDSANGALVPVGEATHSSDEVRALLFDHAEIVREAAASIRERYELAPDPDGLLEGPFTLAQLQRLHEAVLGERLQRDTFRRRMSPRLEAHLDGDGRPTSRTDGGRPAQLWERAGDKIAPGTVQRRLRLPRA
ncbi:ADP-ribose pyrophosphatase YjhB (NUDIX family) [Mumia flava]|uniref:ADP-ribose pyrophosphatase YjhB (NUDIX family) n=1 Tax=Mumia flava TaxID=1348852 RepID=A0A0B2BMZ4_9ACTN|nr:NUDIX hydrolase [Mumia flava]PJJ53758.1 ADP-ribose pyrophosphatase YjhB (NUDIX family) [Mumia flava]